MKILELEQNRDYIDYSELSLLAHQLEKEYNQQGKEKFLGYYYSHIGFFFKTWSSVKLRYLLSVLEWLNPDFPYGGDIPIGRPIVVNEDCFEQIIQGDSKLLDKLADATPTAFQKYGMIVDNFSSTEAVDE